jgi:cytochrome c-type biogenesis protein CcmH
MAVRRFCTRWICLIGIAGLLLTAALPAFAVQPDEMLPNAKLEARARILSRELRCMVCQNQSIDDSDAPLARDIRLLVRERLTAGDSDAQILDFLVARYGQFVLLRPKFEWETALLWLTPLLVFSVGIIAAGVAWRSRKKRSESEMESLPPLTVAEQKRLAEIVAAQDRPA